MKHIITGLLLSLMSAVGWSEMDNSMPTAASNINATQVEITLLFTALLSVFLIILSFRVLDLRGSPVTKWLHAADRRIEQETLERAIRGHGNLIEYAPMFLLLMLCLELEGAAEEQLLLGGTLFTIGRLMHGIVFSFMRPQPVMRIGGMALTFTGFFVLIGSAVSIL
ncbi:MAG: MAPEG family protein [Gammaproteobacteria bacterium]|jgi:uncharacterized membrane protein YecN with MAPEG domain